MLSPETLDVLSTEELIEKTSYEDKYLVQAFLGRMEELVDRYMSIRRGELGKPEIKYSLESVSFSSTYLTVKYSHNGGCCGYDCDDYEIMLTDLFLSEDRIKKIFAEEKAVELQKVAKWLKEKADFEEKARQKKENDEKVLLEQLKKKYEEK
jgi:hypothetical protein